MNLQPFRSSPFARPFVAVTLAATMLAFGCDRPEGSPTANPDAVAQVGEGGSAPADDRGPQATAQQPPPGEAFPGDTAPSAEPVAERTFTADQLEQLVAPVALYPDPLLMDVLMAATYPAEVAEAAAWKKEHPNLNGKALDDAIADKGWDVSVNALTHATQALELMAADPEWTRDLGEAFLAQQDDVLNAVQVMRNRACDAGNLKTTEQQQVVFEEAPAQPAQPAQQYLVPPPSRIVRVVPARPEVLYVPVYNPRVIYGPPPPVVYYPRAWLYPAIHVGVAPVISFGVGLAISGLFWGDADWHHHHVYRRRYHDGYYYDRRPWHERDYSHYESWRHDTRHRRGVSYPREELHRRYRGSEPWIPEDRRHDGRSGGRQFTSPPDRADRMDRIDRGRPGGDRAQREVSPRGPGGKGSGPGQRRDDKGVKAGGGGRAKAGDRGPGAARVEKPSKGGGRPSPGRVEKPSKGGGRPSPGRVEKPSKGGGRPSPGRVEKPSKGSGRPSPGRVEKPSKGGGGRSSGRVEQPSRGSGARAGGKEVGRPSDRGGSSKGRGGGGSAGKRGGDKQQGRGGGKGNGGGR